MIGVPFAGTLTPPLAWGLLPAQTGGGFSVALLVGIAIVASLVTAWTLGANSNSPPFAPAIGANAIPTMRAAFLIGVLAALGAVTQGGSISETVGAGLIIGVDFSALAAAAGLLTAATFMGIGIYSGYPIPAAFATTGAMIGVGLSLGGAPAYATYQRIGTFWVLVPFMSGSVAYATATLLRRDDVPETVGVPLLAAVVGAILANVRIGVIPDPTADQGTLARLVARWTWSGPSIAVGYDLGMLVATIAIGVAAFLALRRRMERSVEQGIRSFLLVLGSVVAYSSGGSQVGLATGPLEHLFTTQLGLPGIALLLMGGMGILAGAWMGAPRLLQATSREYAQLGVRRSIAALVPGFVIAQLAIALGIPISFNNIILSGVIGGGLSAGSAGVSRRKIGVTVLFWILTLVSSIALGFGLYRVLSAVLGVA
ncbi:Phosphate/sulfate permease [Natronoarchaeum philippinense]|uniref:Phosphate transporter n=1 Tax=Natronoarchaeum philippinense TaxID=558529 RepID=A0A285P7J8_NATPI|nr:inorganic phosphate transporter [Natronoarchaeum philippinense]SNZ17237.1 Phosphate/sulfate permease [Natronoarchaeum philippinense]